MNGLDLAPVESAAIGICALMAIFNVFRFKKRGRAAFALALAFVSLGFTIYLFKINAPQFQIIIGTLMTVLLLGADFGLRAKQLPGGRKK